MSIAASALMHVLHTLRSGTDSGKSSLRAPVKCFITPWGRQARVEVGITRLANKDAPPAPARAAEARGSPRSPAAARSPLWGAGAAGCKRSARGAGRASSGRIPAPRAADTRPCPVSDCRGDGQARILATSPAGAAALSRVSRRVGAGREARVPYLGQLPVCFLIVKKRSVSPETTSRRDIGSISETSGQAYGPVPSSIPLPAQPPKT